MSMVVWNAVEVCLKVPLWSEMKYPVILRPVYIVTWSALPLSCLSICHMYQCSSQLMDFHDIWYLGLLWKYVEEFQIWLKSGKSIRHFKRRSRYVLLLLGTLNCHKSALFNWNGIRLLVPLSNCLLFTCIRLLVPLSNWSVVHMYQCGSHWADLRDIWYWGLNENMSRNFKFG